MLFRTKPGVPQQKPGGDGFTLPPRGALGRRPVPKGLSLRGRRRKRESEFLPAFIFGLFLVGTALVASDAGRGRGGLWILSLVGGFAVFALCVRFIYSVEDDRCYRRGEAAPGFLDVVLPRFPSIMVSVLVILVWCGVLILGPFGTGAGTLFFCLLGLSFALIIGKSAQRVLDEIGRAREADDA